MSDSSVITPEEMVLEIQDISDHTLTNKSTLGKIVEVLNERGYIFKGENFERLCNIVSDNYDYNCIVKYEEENIAGFDTNGFFSSPASTKYHGAYDGGLFDHSLEVYRCALKLAKAFDMDDINKISFEACMFHDLCKVGLYKKSHLIQTNGSSYVYADNYVALPHGSESVLRINRLGIKIPRKWEIAVAYHMGAFEADNVRTYGNYCERIPELLLLHTADMMASKIAGK